MVRDGGVTHKKPGGLVKDDVDVKCYGLYHKDAHS